MATDTLFARLRKESGWALLDVLTPMEPEARVEALRRWCLKAAEAHDDAKALHFYEGLMLAIDDAKGGAEQEDAKTCRAHVAIDLYRALPEFRKSRECVDRETYETADLKRETLTDLKKRILADVAMRWSTAKEEDEVSRLAHFLIEVAKKRDRHALDRLTEALKAATKSVWKKERAVRLMTRFLAETDADGEQNPFRTLLIGVMRSLGRQETLMLSMLLIQLPLDTLRGGWNELDGDAVFAALERDAEDYRQMHEVMRELRKALKVPKGQMHAFMPSYPCRGEVELSIAVSFSYSIRGQEENDFHDLAGDLRDQIKAWLKTREAEKQDAPLVKLKIIWPSGGYAPKDSPPRFQRTFELG